MTMNDKNIACIESCHGREFHRAGWIMADASTIVENGYIEVENGVITGIHKGIPKEKSIDHGPGILMPPLVNAHLHLELSALKSRLPFEKGFKTWVKLLLEKRDALSRETLVGNAREGAKLRVSWDDGTVRVIPVRGDGRDGRVKMPDPPGPGRHTLRIFVRSPRAGAAVLDKVVVSR